MKELVIRVLEGLPRFHKHICLPCGDLGGLRGRLIREAPGQPYPMDFIKAMQDTYVRLGGKRAMIQAAHGVTCGFSE